MKEWQRILLLFFLAVVCYWKIFDNYYFLDDTNAVFAGYLLSHDITKIFTYPFDYIYMSPLWRVVVASSYVPNYLISGYDPWSYYLVNLLLHFGNSVLVYIILKKLSDNKNLSLFIAVIFSVSLNKADAVMMVAHRTTLMGTFFVLLSLLFYIRIVLDGYSRRVFLCSLLFFVAALGSYETALVVPAIFITFGLIYKGRDFFTKELVLVNMVFASIVVALVWYLNLGPSTTGGSVITEHTISGKIFHIFRNVLSVFPSFIIPPFILQPAGEVYHNGPSNFGWIEYFSLVLVTAIALASLRMKDKMVLFGLLFFLITSIPSAAPRWAYYPDLPDHRLRFSIGKYSYLSSFGFYVIAGVFLYRFQVYLTERYKNRALMKTASFMLVALYLTFNIYYLYDREKIWDQVTTEARSQIDSLIDLNLKPGNDTNIFIENFVLYSRHATSLLRVIYDNPDLNARDVRDYKPGSARGKSLFLIAEDSNVRAFLISR